MPNQFIKKALQILLPSLFSVLFIAALGVRAGTVTPPATPAASFHTLSGIYALITANTSSAEGSHSFAFSSALEGTGYTLTEIYNALANLISADKVKLGTTYLGVAGSLIPSGGNATVADVLSGKTFFGAAQANWTTQTGTYNASNLNAGTVKKGVTFATSSTGEYSGYPGTGWTGGTPITQAACDAQQPTWYWFEDANGDGDTTDPEDGVCVKATTADAVSWNGAEQIGTTNFGNQATASGTANSITRTGTGWTVNIYANSVVKITGGTASGCWGVVKSNTADTITVYGSWLSSAYASNCGTPDATSLFGVYRDGFATYDNGWIGDWTCTGSFPNGTPVWGSYPTSTQVGASRIALASADCYDGVRDLLPNEIDRAVITGTATAANATSITDSSLTLNVNGWVGQKVLITGGTGAGGWGRIESNTATSITVESWTGGTPAAGSAFAIIYLIPHANFNPNSDVDGTNDDYDQLNGANGPLVREVLKNWKGTRLPSADDFYGYCGYRTGSGLYQNTAGSNTANKHYGNFGGQAGRTDEYIDLANTIREWLSDRGTDTSALTAGDYACSYASRADVYGDLRFRAVFRP